MRSTILLLALAFLPSACSSLSGPGGDGSGTGNWIIEAKSAALIHVIDTMPEEEKTFGAKPYAVYAVHDKNPAYQAELIRRLGDRRPRIVSSKLLYSRGEYSKWHRGEPAIVWTSSIAQPKPVKGMVEVTAGWMHSALIGELTVCTLRKRRDGRWRVVAVRTPNEEGPGSPVEDPENPEKPTRSVRFPRLRE